MHERKLAAERIEYLAYYDSLTALPNRSLFSKHLHQALDMARRYGGSPAVLFVDLDRFKNINDTLGHEAGDLLLQEMAKRFRSCLRESDVVARLGGDEFVVLLPKLENPADGRAGRTQSPYGGEQILHGAGAGVPCNCQHWHKRLPQRRSRRAPC